MKVYKNFDLTNFNSYNIQSTCEKAYFPDSENDIVDFFKNNTTYNLIGSGHNIILSKKKYRKPFLILNNNFNNVVCNDTTIIGEAGVSMFELSLFALENSLKGLEVFYDIPSSLGGAVVMNAGAFGEDIKDIITKVRYLDISTFEVNEIENIDIDFEYRNSFFQKNKDKIILKVWLSLSRANKTEIKIKMDSLKEKRWAKQPRNHPNAGSVFKRPKGFYVGQIIEDLNLKGFKIGGAKISEKHGGFIVNYDNATGEDILNLIEHINNKVYQNYGMFLEVEQRVI